MKQIRATNIPAAVAEALRKQIASGERKPGDRLPGNRELAAAFGVSMGSVREAISTLISEGLIDARAGRGTYVTRDAATSGMTVVAGKSGRVLDRRSVQELIEAREILELQLVALAAQRASAAEIGAIHGALERMAANVDDPAAYSEADVEFHMAVAQAAGNRVLLDAMANIRALLRNELELSNEVGARRYGDLQFSHDSHRRVADAIEAGDPERARAELFEIMSRNHELVLGLYAAPASGTVNGSTVSEGTSSGMG